MEKTKDKKQIWRKYVNDQLKLKYKKLYSQLNCLIYLKARNFNLLQKWRLKQERKLWLNSKRKSNLKIMSKEDVLSFMQTYQRVTQNMFRYMPKYASIILNLDNKHQMKSAIYKKKMKKILIVIFNILFLLSHANAETFIIALKKAYTNNSELNAERENIYISEEELKISRGSYLPTITLEGTKSEEDTNKLTNQSGGDATITDADPLTKSISISQTIFDFGRGAELSKSKIGINLAKAKLLKKEQDILYKTVEAYTGLLAANEKLEINRANVELLNRQVETDRIRLERGKISLSDVSQSESSLAGAQAKFIQAQNELLTSKLNYENIIGNINDPKSLDKTSITDYELPENLGKALELSEINNPDLIIAKLDYEQSQKDTSIAKSELAPTAKLSLEKSYSEDFNSTYDEREKETLKATRYLAILFRWKKYCIS